MGDFGDFRLGIDVGGTFVDAVLLNDVTGECEIWKTPSNPSAPAQAVLSAVEEAIRRAPAGSIRLFVHAHEVSSSGRLLHSGRYQTVQSLDACFALDGLGVSRFWTLWRVMNQLGTAVRN